jgi:16S rRNA (cytosine1402-N4)-methyltransferase
VPSRSSGSDVAHIPVLLRETLELLAVRPGGFYVDGTLGLGGHAKALLEQSAPSGRLLGVDKDSETLEEARLALAPFGDRARLVHGDFREIPGLLGGERPDGILLDLGVSSMQLDRAERGFSFRTEGPLDMRMDRSFGETAENIVNRERETELANLIFRFGEERASRRIAKAIVLARRKNRIRTTLELATIVRASLGRSRDGLDPATRTFQALRIAVNRELESLPEVFTALGECLAPGGRLAVIAFHSLEDREVKTTFRGLSQNGFRLLTRKPMRPAPEETAQNPRSRSARLRAVEKEAA